ncbi:MAG: hypothetical protein Q7V57_02210 [Actinomycetota bacterium]|nr:hypothetical protein [Actinomycetota bacterium]
MTENSTIDITSSAFALRLGNLLVSTRGQTHLSRFALARESQGRFRFRDLRDLERGTRRLDEQTIDDVAQLYRCDLGVILPHRLPVMVTGYEVSAGGVHQSFVPDEPDALLLAYLRLVRSLRHQRRMPVVDLRRDDLEALSSYLHEPRETVLHQVATLMNATQRKRAAMVGVLASGAAVVGLASLATAVNGPSASTVDDTVPPSVSVAPTLSTVADTVVTTNTVAVTTTAATVAPTVVATRPPVVVRPGGAKPTDTTAFIDETNFTFPTETPPVVVVEDPPVPSTNP